MNDTWDFTGVNEAGDFSPFPAGVYKLRVENTEDKTTGNGDPMVLVTLRIVNTCAVRGKTMRHQVTFKKPDEAGAGFAKHWLRVIGQPFEGRVRIDTDRWEGKEFIARVGIEEYSSTKGGVRHKNTIEASWNLADKDIPPIGSEVPKTVASIREEANAKAKEEVPF